MPLVQIRLIESVFSRDQKREMIRKVTDAMTSVTGEALRDKLYVIIEDNVRDGDWGIGGEPISAEHVRALTKEKGKV